MNGARERVILLNQGIALGIVKKINGYGIYRFNNLIFNISYHARGTTLHIYVVDNDFDESLVKYTCLNQNDLEVFGITGGQPGWTETYGWLHKGKWIDSFNDLLDMIKDRKAEADTKNELRKSEQDKKSKELEQEKIDRFNKLF